MVDLGYAWNAYLLVTYYTQINVSLRGDCKLCREMRIVLNKILLAILLHMMLLNQLNQDAYENV